MPVSEKYLAVFEEDRMYHVYNRTNNKELLFLTDANRSFFLEQFSKYLSPFIDVHCWCLLPNHFHFLIGIKSKMSIREYLQSLPDTELKAVHKHYLADQEIEVTPFEKVSPLVSTNDIIISTFRRFFTSYSMAFNKQHKRTGNLFQRPFKRVLIEDDHQYTQAIIYVHANPLKHKITKDFTAYEWSSYREIIEMTSLAKPVAGQKMSSLYLDGAERKVSPLITSSAAKELIDWFGSTERFVRDHLELSHFYEESNVAIEDD